jgi:hypothetical protein
MYVMNVTSAAVVDGEGVEDGRNVVAYRDMSEFVETIEPARWTRCFVHCFEPPASVDD